eukprot:12373412-Ditylum_brightwellii.AAC.1
MEVGDHQHSKIIMSSTSCQSLTENGKGAEGIVLVVTEGAGLTGSFVLANTERSSNGVFEFVEEEEMTDLLRFKDVLQGIKDLQYNSPYFVLAGVTEVLVAAVCK